MSEKPPEYFRYWGKKNNDKQWRGDRYHLLPYHSLDVAAVGFHLFNPEKALCRDIAQFLGIEPSLLQRLFAFILSVHDLGKFTSAFQGLCSELPDQFIAPHSRKPYDAGTHRHDQLGCMCWRYLVDKVPEFTFYNDKGIEDSKDKNSINKGLEVLLLSAFGHHGMPSDGVVRLSELSDYTECHNFQAMNAFIDSVSRLLPFEIDVRLWTSKEWKSSAKQMSWYLAGAAVIADWLGSNIHKFPYVGSPRYSLEEYWDIALSAAENAVSSIDFNADFRAKPFVSIQHHFGFLPSPLQEWAASIEINSSPQLFILEDVTGAGKTEAALAITHRLMENGVADGFYFGLPTMATSNAMFSRVSKQYKQMLETRDGLAPSIVLAHGGRDMHEEFRESVIIDSKNEYATGDIQYGAKDHTATAQCHEWLADSRKKALLAPVGVGTMDQVLLSVLPKRHQSLRVLGMHRKVLIFDEVHSSDEYMLELLKHVLLLHRQAGGSVILLTATLSYRQRSALCEAWQQDSPYERCSPTSNSFPLATKVDAFLPTPLIEAPINSRAGSEREVPVQFLHTEEDCIDLILDKVACGDCVVWVKNSVDDAIRAYQQLTECYDPQRCILFHSRFIARDRQLIEASVLEKFGKNTDRHARYGQVLIATQVFQESLDADADWMISDLCPIDDLIQRAGRLGRHNRDEDRCVDDQALDTRRPVLFVHAPDWSDNPDADWLKNAMPNTHWVYQTPGRLWLTMNILRQLGAIRTPNEARVLIEAVYGDEADQSMPDVFKAQDDAYSGSERAKGNAAKNLGLKWQAGYSIRSHKVWSEDIADIGTRYSDRETANVVLVRIRGGKLIPYVEGGRFAVQLSTVKVDKLKYGDRLKLASEQYQQQFLKDYRGTKYSLLWVLEEDDQLGYSEELGFFEVSPR